MCQKGDVSQFFFMMHILYGVIRLGALDFSHLLLALCWQ